MAYFNYHAKAQRLIKDGHLLRFEIVPRWGNIAPALVLYFDNNRTMPIREHKFAEYIELITADSLRFGCVCGIILYYFSGISAPIFSRRSGCDFARDPFRVRAAPSARVCGWGSAPWSFRFSAVNLLPRGVLKFLHYIFVAKIGGYRKICIIFLTKNVYLGGVQKFLP